MAKFRCGFVAIIACFICLFAMVVDANALTLFRRQSVSSRNITDFPKWTTLLQHYAQQQAQAYPSPHGQCFGAACMKQQWNAIKGQAKQYYGYEQLVFVNQSLNHLRYIRDIVNWGVEDYWASPVEFLVRNGDCEDYAIAKYMMLRELGWPVESMQIVVAQDQSLNALHSILAVELNNVHYVFDNQIAQLLTDQQIHHYWPIYAINEAGWWRFL